MGNLYSLMFAGVPARFVPTAKRATVQTGAEYHELFDELSTALHTDPTALVATPGFRDAAQRTSAVDVLGDMFAGEGDTLLQMLVGLLPMAVKSQDTALRLSAQAIVATACAQHAAFHEADLQDLRADADEVPA
jgi:hypothetical protein